MTATTTAPRYEIRKAATGWELVGRNYSGQEVSVQGVGTREAARELLRSVKAQAAAPVESEAMAVAERAYELAAGVADVAPLAVVTLDGEEQTVEVAATPVKAPKAKAVKAPKVAAPKGELTVVRKLEAGQRFTVKGVGLVKVVGRVKVDGQKFLVEYEDATGEYGSTEMWANSRVRLAA